MELEFRHLVDALPGLICTLLPDGRVEFLNQRWREYAGLHPKDPVGSSWQAAIHPEDLPEFQQAWDRIRDSGAPGEIELRLRRLDGQHRWFGLRLAPMVDDRGGIARWCGMAVDADERGPGDSDRRLRRFAHGMPTQVIFLTPNGELEYVNREVMAYYGASLEELKNWATGGYIHPDDLGEVFDRLARTMSTGESYDAHSRMRRYDGVYRWFRSRMLPSRDGQGNIVRYVSVQTDVDDLKRAEHLMMAEVQLLEMVARGRPLAEVLRALCLQVEELSPGCLCSVLLVSEGGRTFDVMAGPSLPDAYNKALDKMTLDPGFGCCSLAARTKAPVICADVARDPRWTTPGWAPMLAPHGIVSCWAMPILSGRDEVLGVFSLYRHEATVPSAREQQIIDRFTKIAGISIERAVSDAALQARDTELTRAHAHLTEAQRLSKTGSFTWDVQADEHIWSHEIRRIFGFPANVPITLPMIQTAIHPDDMAAVGAVIGRAFQGEDFELIFRIVATDGSIRHAHVVGHRNHAIADRPVFLGALRDITENKAAEEALHRARAELAHVTRVMTVGALTASIAHEVNQPLSGIITNATTCLRMLSADPPNIDGARMTAQRSLRDGNRAAEVVQRLRALFARKQPEAAAVDLNDAAREVIALCASELHQHRVAVCTEFEAALPAARGDRVQLQQVILNLILNAADAMRAVDHRPRNLLIATARDDEQRVRLTVRDSGTGIEPEHQEKLFQAFYTTKSHGMGVGLSISRSIIESHDGRLWATANPDYGATFSFSIPSLRAPYCQPPPSALNTAT